MTRGSIIYKLFILILVSLIMIMVVQWTFTQFYLDPYYRNKSVDEAYVALEDLALSFNDLKEVGQQAKLLNNYMGEVNEPVLVLNDDLDYHPASLQTAYESTITLQTQAGERVIPFFEEDLFMSGIEVGAILTLTLAQEDEFTYPVLLTYQGTTYDLISEEEWFYLDESEVTFIEEEARLISVSDLILDETMLTKITALDDYVFEAFIEQGQAQSDLYEFIMVEVDASKGPLYFVSMVSLQPIYAITDIISGFQFYIFILSVVVAFLLAAFVSKTLAKPILDLTQATNRYTQLDLTSPLILDRKDELGGLSKGIHYLASSLKDKIDELKEVNNQLEDDIAFERRQEQIRKQFVSDVSHELKTPLGVIKSYAEGLADGISPNKQGEYLGVINKEVEKMNALIVDMLELSHLDASQTLGALERCNVKRMVENQLRQVDKQVVDEGISLKLDLQEVWALVDTKKFETLLVNLISNAIRYATGQRLIHVKLSAKGPMSELLIYNTCQPIDDHDLKRLWDRFYRVEQSRSRQLGGNGLGLAIVKHILDLHGFGYDIKNMDGGIGVYVRWKYEDI